MTTGAGACQLDLVILSLCRRCFTRLFTVQVSDAMTHAQLEGMTAQVLITFLFHCRPRRHMAGDTFIIGRGERTIACHSRQDEGRA